VSQQFSGVQRFSKYEFRTGSVFAPDHWFPSRYHAHSQPREVLFREREQMPPSTIRQVDIREQ